MTSFMIFMLVLVKASCFLGQPHDSNNSKQEITSSEGCNIKSKKLGRWIRLVYDFNGKIRWGMDDFEKANLAVVDHELDIPKPAPYIFIRKNNVYYQHNRVDKPYSSIHRFLEAQEKEINVIKIYIDRDSIWEDVVEVTRGLRKKKQINLAFVFEYCKAQIPKPERSFVEDKLKEEYSNLKMKENEVILYSGLSKKLEKDLSKCPDILNELKSLINNGYDYNGILWADIFSKALLKCDCQIKSEILQSILWRFIFIGDPNKPTQRVIKMLSLAPEGIKPAAIIRGHAKTSWSEAYKWIIASKKDKYVVLDAIYVPKEE